MSCTLNKGREVPCKDSVGGIEAVYLFDYGDLSAAVQSSVDGEEDSIIGFAGGTTGYKYAVKGNSSLEQTVNASRENGTVFYDQVLNLTLTGLTQKDHKEVRLIASGRPQVLIKDYNGNYFVTGLEHGMDVNGGTIVTGAAMGDLSGYTLTLQGMEKKPANFVVVTSEVSTTLTFNDSSTVTLDLS